MSTDIWGLLGPSGGLLGPSGDLLGPSGDLRGPSGGFIGPSGFFSVGHPCPTRLRVNHFHFLYGLPVSLYKLVQSAKKHL